MTSMGAKVNESINDGGGPYVFKISGQPCHRIGSLLPPQGCRPEYAQLYIHDTEQEVAHRINVASSSNSSFSANETIVASLIQMFDAHNPIVKLFRTAREKMSGQSQDRYRIRLYGKVDAHGDIFSMPVASEVVGLVVGDIGMTDVGRDIIIEDHSSTLQRIDESYCKFMAMQYPILFPYGEDGFQEDLTYRPSHRSESIKRKKVTMLEYYAYRLHDRPGDFNTPLRGKRLTQAYVVDSYCCVEGKRVRHYRKPSFQQKYRSAPYNSLAASVSRGITSGSSAGQRIILPASFTGGPRYLYQNYQDCIAICRKYGCPDLFVTFTSNAAWPEIFEALAPFPGLQPADRPDIIDRVFKMKLNILMDDIKKHKFFGPINAGKSYTHNFASNLSLFLITPKNNTSFFSVVYTIEFQKRGLPHVHIIIWLDKDEPLNAEKIDSYISAQLPDPKVDPIGYDAVSSFMVHGPCGPLNPGSICMSEGKCSKFYPKDFCEQTTIMENGFTQYARPRNGITVRKNGVDIDNRFVVPHNVDLVVKFQAHINVEKVNHDGMHKYLFKYVTKGFDCSKVGIHSQSSSSSSSNETINEIDNFLECRCITPHDAAWRLLQYDIHHTDPSVERLPVHLPLENNVVYAEDDDLQQVIADPKNTTTKLTAWLEANAKFPSAREHTYIEFPENWTWHADGKYWHCRRGGYKKIGRIAHVNPSQGELYYLRMLLHIVKGSKSFSEIRTVAGHEYPTFRAACDALGLLGDDQEWSNAINDAAQWALPYQLRQLFVTILLFCEVTNPKRLYDDHASKMSEDITHRANRNTSTRNISSTDNFIQSLLLLELDKLLRDAGYSLSHFNLPVPEGIGSVYVENRLILDELNYDVEAMLTTVAADISRLNKNQRVIFDTIYNSVANTEGRTFFIYGHGGTGKTFLWTTLLNYVRSQGKIALAVASSGIASLLLPGGRTPHSRFKIPLDIKVNSMCSIKKIHIWQN
jgi:hypothetical protein